MIEVILITIIIFSVITVFQVQTRIMTENRRRERAARAFAEYNRMHDNRAQTETQADARTIDLIGEEAYKEMTARIDALLARHGNQRCVSLELTCGPDTKAGAKELHSLLPGMRLELNICSEGGTRLVDVYSNGTRIGRLALSEASVLTSLMEGNSLKGAYVAEQNCYGLEDSHQMAVIVFYEPRKEESGRTASSSGELGKLAIKEIFSKN